MQNPAFDEAKYKFFDVNWDAPMNTVSGITEWGRDINGVYSLTTIICTVVFFAVAIPLIMTRVKFKRKDGDETPPAPFHGSLMLEVLWTVIPVVLLLFIAVPTWRVLFKHAKHVEGAMEVEVIGHQWWWEFRYPQDGKVITANELHLPENTPVHFKIWSADVIHSFWIPKFGGKVDAMPTYMKDGIPSRTNELSLHTPSLGDANKKGGEMFQGQCVELCGASHALMRFNVVIHSKAEFDSWAKSANTPPAVETSLAKAGEQVFGRCVACHTISGTASENIPGDKIGPNLSNFGNRKYLGAGTRLNTSENLATWLRDPAAVKPGSLMPNLGLTETEISQVSSYLRLSTAKNY